MSSSPVRAGLPRGLSEAEVRERVLSWQVNAVTAAPGRTIGQILRANVLTGGSRMNVGVDDSRPAGGKKDLPAGRCPLPRPAAGWRLCAAGAVAVVLSVAACGGTGPVEPAVSGSQSPAASSAAAPSSSGADPSLQQQYERVVSKVLPSVVQISTSQGSGSGVVYDTKGDIVTNAHVVGTATTLRVGLASGGQTLTATVVGVFAPDDLAVIRVRAGSGALHPASFGRSASVRVGEIVLAMGNPAGHHWALPHRPWPTLAVSPRVSG